MLTTLLPWAALLIAAMAVFLRDGLRSEVTPGEKPNVATFLSAAVLALLALVAGWFWRESLKDLWPTSIGFVGGAFAALLSLTLSGLRGQAAGAIAAPIGIGVFGAAVWTLVAVEAREPYQLGAAAGVGLAGWLLGTESRGWAARSAIVMALCLLADVLGQRAAGGHSAQAGSVLGLLVALSAVLSSGFPKRPESEAKGRAIGVAVGTAVLIFGAWLLAGRYFFIQDLWTLFAGAAAVALIVAWLVPDEGASTSSFVMATIIWLAAATLAFGLRKGYGLSVMTLGGAAMLFSLGRSRALLTLGPVAMLTVYRVFRELHTDASRALDIGQHYALIGLTVGAALLVLASEWRTERPSRPATAWAGLLWIPMFLAVPFVSGVVLAAKGFVGVLAGLGFGPLANGIKGAARVDILSLELGVGAAMAGGYGWMSGKLDLAREDKVKALIWVAAMLVVLAACVVALSRERADGAPETSS